MYNICIINISVLNIVFCSWHHFCSFKEKKHSTTSEGLRLPTSEIPYFLCLLLIDSQEIKVSKPNHEQSGWLHWPCIVCASIPTYIHSLEVENYIVSYIIIYIYG